MPRPRKDRQSKPQPMPSGEGDALLNAFGKFIEVERRRKNLSQSEFAERIQENANRDLKASQTLVARIENGSQEPRPELIKAMAQVLDKTQLELVGKLVESKYEIEPTLLSFLFRRPKTLEQLAEWERSPDHKELWIVTTVYVDPKNKMFEESVSEIINREGGAVTFFIPRSKLSEFMLWRRAIFPTLTDKASPLNAVPFELKQQAVMATAFAIANPSHLGQKGKTPPIGYLILNNANAEPEFAIEMYPGELVDRIVLLNSLLKSGELKYNGEENQQ
jgi:transcriptional regulator with XRE-family HTH domain